MSVTPASFRATLTEFDDPGKYPDAAINFWITAAGNLLNCDRWDTLIDLGTSLFVAHHLVLAAHDQRAAKVNGGIPGAAQGVLTSKSVDKVSASYDASSISLTDGTFWNMTSYGIRFLTYARMVGAGGLQVGAGHFDGR